MTPVSVSGPALPASVPPRARLLPDYVSHVGSRLRRCIPGLCLALALACSGAVLLPSGVQAQESATGTISGRVLNANNGRFLKNARVNVEGGAQESVTNEFGEYTLRNVPAGEVSLRIFYTGLEPRVVTVAVPAGETVSRDIRLGRDAAVTDDGTVVLDEFVVSAERFQTAQQIAINEERFSVNIKNVVAADAFGDIPSGNIGEFVKFIPGVLIEYGAYGGSNQGVADSDATGISVRGFEAADTAITIDGMPVSNAFPGTLTRQVGLDMLTINNASRVEVTKVPTPDMPANSIGGQINLVTKSAFELARPSIGVEFFVTGNTDDLTFSSTPGPTDRNTMKIVPSMTFSAAYPITRNFGVSLTGSIIREFKENQRAQRNTWTVNNPSIPSGSTAEAAAELYRTAYANTMRLERLSVTDSPAFTTRKSGNLRFDWRPFEGHTLSANFQASTYNAEEAQRRLDFRTGTAQSWTATEVIGQQNNNNPRIAMTVTTRDKTGNTESGSLSYKIQKGGWDVFAAASSSVSSGEFLDASNGHFSEVAGIIGGTTNARVRVDFLDIADGIPGRVRVLSNGGAGSEVDYTQLSGWRFDGLSAKSGVQFSKDTTDVYRLDVRRDLDFIPYGERMGLALKAGVRRDQKKNEKWGIGTGYEEEQKTGTTVNFADVIDTVYVNESPGFGLPGQQWLSSYKLYELDQANDIFDVLTESRRINNYNSYVNQQKSIKETKDAWYAQVEGRLFSNRLSFVGGLRSEDNKREGRGPFTDNRYNYVKNLDGTVYREGNVGDPYYNGVRFSAANDPLFTNVNGIQQRLQSLGLWYPTNANGTPRVLTNSTLEGRMLQLQANRPIKQKAEGKPSYSLNLSYDVRDDLVAKFGWSRTFGQIPLEESGNIGGIISGSGQFTYSEFNEPDTDGYIGEIKVANPALEPKVSTNYDLALSYYYAQGSKVTVSYYWKEVENLQVTYRTVYGDPAFDVVLAALGLPIAEFEDFYLTTTGNGTGSQKTDGFEIDVQQNLGFLGEWGRRFSMFASYTQKSLGDPVDPKPIPVTRPDGTVIDIAPSGQRTITQTANRFAGAGIVFSTPRFSVSVKGTYRNRNERPGRQTISFGGEAINYIRTFDPSETRIDLSADYRLNDKFSLFVTGKDIFNNARKQIRMDDLGWIPAYATAVDTREFGVAFTCGVRGRF